MDSKANLYGTTEFGGANQTGTVFELSPATGGGWTETVIYTFGRSGKGDGQFPASGLTFDAQGNMFAATVGGVPCMKAHRMSCPRVQVAGRKASYPAPAQFSQLPKRWSQPSDRSSGRQNTVAPVGSTMTGGSDGSIYRLWFNNGHWVEKSMHDNGGEQTGGDLVMDRNLNIYGATNNAGANATGSV